MQTKTPRRKPTPPSEPPPAAPAPLPEERRLAGSRCLTSGGTGNQALAAAGLTKRRVGSPLSTAGRFEFLDGDAVVFVGNAWELTCWFHGRDPEAVAA